MVAVWSLVCVKNVRPDLGYWKSNFRKAGGQQSRDFQSLTSAHISIFLFARRTY
jgi:hypothetical protein